MFSRLLFNRKSLFEALRYALASVAALGIDSTILFTLHYAFDVPLAWATALGFFFGIIVIYFLSIKHVFDYRRIEKTPAQELFWFWISGAIGLLLTITSVMALSTYFEMSPPIAKILTAGVVFTFNFIFRKIVLFTNWKENSEHVE